MRLIRLSLVIGACVLGSVAAAAGSTDEGLAGVETWGFAIGNGTLKGDLARRYLGYDLLVVDGQQARGRQVRALRARGTIVLGYLSVGTIETYRPWYRRLKPYRLEAWKDWKGEFFADVSRAGFRRQISRRIAPKMLDKGLDGLFLDNLDMIESHRRQAPGMRRLVDRLTALIDRRGRLLFAQNGYRVLEPFLDSLDGWNREDVTGTYDFDRRRYLENSARRVARAQRELRAVDAAGLLVTATDYTRRAGGGTFRRAISSACAAGALPYVSDIGLRRTPAPPLRCP